MKNLKKLGSLLLVLLLLAAYVFLQSPGSTEPESSSADTIAVLETEVTREKPEALPEDEAPPEEAAVPVPDEDGEYTSKEDVALYLHIYGRLPSNFITKKQAQKLGWEGGDLWKFAKGKSIGGDHFGNYEGVLPDRDYRECDIDYHGGKRSGKRLVFSEDGFIYYTDDHYESFELLYGEE